MSTGYPVGTIKVLKVNSNDDWAEEVLTSDDINFIDGIVASGGNLEIKTITDHSILLKRNNINYLELTSSGINLNQTSYVQNIYPLTNALYSLGISGTGFVRLVLNDGNQQFTIEPGSEYKIGTTSNHNWHLMHQNNPKIIVGNNSFAPAAAGYTLGNDSTINAWSTAYFTDGGDVKGRVGFSGNDMTVGTTTDHELRILQNSNIKMQIFSGSIQTRVNLNPNEDGTISLGSPSLGYSSNYFSNSSSKGKIAFSGNTLEFGSTTNDTLNLLHDNEVKLQLSTAIWAFDNIYPETTGTHNIGSGTYSFKSVSLSNDSNNTSQAAIAFTGNDLYIGTSTSSTGLRLRRSGADVMLLDNEGIKLIDTLIPNVDGARNLGSTVKGFQRLFLSRGDGTPKWQFDANTTGSDAYLLIHSTASDGSDAAIMSIGAGGASGESRGGGIVMWGNEHSTTTNRGRVIIRAGNRDSGDIILETHHADAEIDLKLNAVSKLTLTAGQTTIADNTTFEQNVTIEGNLTVTGNQTILNTEEVQIEDNIITLNSTASGSPSLDAGIEIERGSETNARLLWDESTDSWKIGEVGSEATVLTNPITENLIFTPSTFQISANTSDGSDNKALYLAGGGSASNIRGGSISLFGNEHASTGSVVITTGGSGMLSLLTSSASGDILISPYNNSGGRQTKFRGSDGALQFTPTDYKIIADTSDGSDTKVIHIGGGGDTTYGRGAFISLYGNEHSTNPSNILLTTGDISTAHLDLSASDYIKINTNSGERFKINSSGNILYNNVTGQILANTSDGSDNKAFIVAGGGDSTTSRGAMLSVRGNEFPSSPGQIQLVAGNVDGAKAVINASATSNGAIDLQIASTTRWSIGSTGNFVPGSNNTYNIGVSGTDVANVYTRIIRSSSSTIDFYPNHLQTFRFQDNGSFACYSANFDIRNFYGNDEGKVRIGGGSDVIDTEGAVIALYGNSASSNAGDLLLSAGNTSGAEISLYAGGSKLWSLNNLGNLYPESDGDYSIGNISSGAKELHLSNGTARAAYKSTSFGAVTSHNMDFFVNGTSNYIMSLTSQGIRPATDGQANVGLGTSSFGWYSLFLSDTADHSTIAPKQWTQDANDQYLFLGGGSSIASSAGSWIGLYGVSAASNAGDVTIYGGNNSGADIKLVTNVSNGEIHLRPGSAENGFSVNSTGIIPQSDNHYDIGSPSNRIKDIYVANEVTVSGSPGIKLGRDISAGFIDSTGDNPIELRKNGTTQLIVGAGGINIPNNLVVEGNLSVSGTTTTLNTDELLIEDNQIILNSTASGTPSINAGILIERGDSTNASILWDESSDTWKFGLEGAEEPLLTSDNFLLKSNNLSDVNNTDTARGNINAAKDGENSDITSLTNISSISDNGNMSIGPSSSNTLQLNIDGSSKWTLWTDGGLYGDQSSNIIGSNTTDGSDNAEMSLCGGGAATSSRGAYVKLRGNEHGSTGECLVVAGNTSGGVLKLYTTASEPIEFFTAGSKRWEFNSSGHLVPNGNDTYDIGTDSVRARYVYMNVLRVTNKSDARSELGLGSVAVEDVVPLSKGGTGTTGFSATRIPFSTGSALTSDGELTYDTTNDILRAGVAVIGDRDSSQAHFRYAGLGETNDYCLLHTSVGDTYLNASASRDISFRINNGDQMVINSSTIEVHNEINMNGNVLDMENGTINSCGSITMNDSSDHFILNGGVLYNTAGTLRLGSSSHSTIYFRNSTGDSGQDYRIMYIQNENFLPKTNLGCNIGSASQAFNGINVRDIKNPSAYHGRVIMENSKELQFYFDTGSGDVHLNTLGNQGDFVPIGGGQNVGLTGSRWYQGWFSGGIQPFTGEHVYQCKSGENLQPGEAVKLVNGQLERCSSSQEKTCVGILDNYLETDPDNIPISTISGEYPVYDSLNNLVPSGTLVASVAAVGDNYTEDNKGFRVCNENGNIAAGDYLCTASGYPGHLKKQDDDILHSYTVGKSMEDITFSGSPTASGIYGFLCCG